MKKTLLAATILLTTINANANDLAFFGALGGVSGAAAAYQNIAAQQQNLANAVALRQMEIQAEIDRENRQEQYRIARENRRLEQNRIDRAADFAYNKAKRMCEARVAILDVGFRGQQKGKTLKIVQKEYYNLLVSDKNPMIHNKEDMDFINALVKEGFALDPKYTGSYDIIRNDGYKTCVINNVEVMTTNYLNTGE